VEAKMTTEPAANEVLLPDPLSKNDGARVECAAQWENIRRPELLRDFGNAVYGETPRVQWTPQSRVVSERVVFGGLATRRLIEVGFEECPLTFSLLLWVPLGGSQPVPAFLGLNFNGNYATTFDSDIPHPDAARVPTNAAVGSDAANWPVEMFVRNGFALATACYGELEPDHPDGWRDGFRAELPFSNWGAIGVWAWGLSRALDVLETQSDVDATRVSVMGHSRLGKTALWAGAQDERFALVISANSGCGGAAPSRREGGESVDAITRAFPHWFAPQFAAFRGREAKLPVDQHELLALIAPRPLYVASAEGDLWADPHGEWLSCVAASPVWELWGKRGLGMDDPPQVGVAFGESVGYHLRAGGHDQTAWDFERFIAFAARHFSSCNSS